MIEHLYTVKEPKDQTIEGCKIKQTYSLTYLLSSAEPEGEVERLQDLYGKMAQITYKALPSTSLEERMMCPGCTKGKKEKDIVCDTEGIGLDYIAP